MLKIKEYLLRKELWCAVAPGPLILFGDKAIEMYILYIISFFALYYLKINWLISVLTGTLITMPLILSGISTTVEAGFYFGAIFAATNLTLRLFFSEFLERF